MIKTSLSQIEKGTDLLKIFQSKCIDDNEDGKWGFGVTREGNLGIKYDNQVVATLFKKPGTPEPGPAKK